MAAQPMRLHPNLLFYGLAEGTWTNQPSPSNANDSEEWKRAWEDVESGQEALWGNPGDMLRSPSTAAGSTRFGNEQSTDEGSEAKGSESDSLPDSSEGYLVSNQQLFSPSSAAAAPAVLSYMPTNTAQLSGASTMVPSPVPSHDAAAAVYNSYLTQGSFLSTNGFAGNDVASHYGYDVGATPSLGHYTYDVGPSVATTGVTPGVMDDNTVTPGIMPDASGADGVPSIGSYAHLSGQCSRCCFHPKGRCSNGFNCEFCHYDHDKRPRNGKKKRYRRQLDGTMTEEVDGFEGTGFLVAGLE